MCYGSKVGLDYRVWSLREMQEGGGVAQGQLVT